MDNWFEVKNSEVLMSPALLFYKARIEHNIKQMIAIAGSADRLRPHIKTHKCLEIIQLQLKQGISKFKCATLTEAELLASCGVEDILIAYPLVGPMQEQLGQLIKRYPNVRFAVLIDNKSHLNAWQATQNPIEIFIDLDVGMNRTGILPQDAPILLAEIKKIGYTFRGWHIYDGHIHASDLNERKQLVEEAFSPVQELLAQTQTEHLELVCGGSITFPIHAKDTKRNLSPGTTLLWDHGYGSHFPDLSFHDAASLLTRVISKPGKDRLCLDLGHKAVASEMKESPVYFPQLPNAEIVVHSEEHLVLKTPDAEKWAIGAVLYGIPYHICPTVALHSSAALVEDKMTKTFWDITARNRQYIHE